MVSWSCLKCPADSEGERKKFTVYNQWQVARHFSRMHGEVPQECING